MLAEVTDVARQTADGGIHLTGAGFFVIMTLWFCLCVVVIIGSGRR